jgi:hypothetical protein
MKSAQETHRKKLGESYPAQEKSRDCRGRG